MTDPVTTLAIPADVVKCLGRPFAGSDDDRADQLLILATSGVTTWTNYKFFAGDYTISRNADEEIKIDLPGVIDEVSEVRDINQLNGQETILASGTDYTVRGSSIYLMRPHRVIEIDFTIADETVIPEEVVTLVANMVARSLAGPPVGASSESAGGFSISYVNTSGDVYLSKTDKTILGKYRQTHKAISLF